MWVGETGNRVWQIPPLCDAHEGEYYVDIQESEALIDTVMIKTLNIHFVIKKSNFFLF